MGNGLFQWVTAVVRGSQANQNRMTVCQQTLMSSYSHNQRLDLQQSWKGHSTTAHANGTHPSLAQRAICLNTGIEITTLIKRNHWCLLDILINTLTNSKSSNIFLCSLTVVEGSQSLKVCGTGNLTQLL